MSIPDPVTTGVVTAAALQAAKQGQDFIAAAAGRPGESIATILGDWARQRIVNAETIGNKAHFTLLNLGVEQKEVPFNVMQPLLEAARRFSRINQGRSSTAFILLCRNSSPSNSNSRSESWFASRRNSLMEISFCVRRSSRVLAVWVTAAPGGHTFMPTDGQSRQNERRTSIGVSPSHHHSGTRTATTYPLEESRWTVRRVNQKVHFR